MSIICLIKQGDRPLKENQHKFEIGLSTGDDMHYNYAYFCNEVIKIADVYGCILSDYKVDNIYNIVTFSLYCDNNQLMCFINDVRKSVPKAEILKY